MIIKESDNYRLEFVQGTPEELLEMGLEGPYVVINKATGYADVSTQQYLAALQSLIQFVKYHPELEEQLEDLLKKPDLEGRQNVFDFKPGKPN